MKIMNKQTKMSVKNVFAQLSWMVSQIALCELGKINVSNLAVSVIDAFVLLRVGLKMATYQNHRQP